MNDIPFGSFALWFVEGIGWLTATFLGVTAALAFGIGAVPSPSLIRDSIVFSTFPLKPFSTLVFRFSSVNPMSLNCASFASILSLLPPTLAPNTLDCLLTRSGSSCHPLPAGGDRGGDVGPLRCRGRTEDTLRKPNPKRFAGFGGRGGGWSSELRVLPVSFLTAGRTAPLVYDCWSYFCRMKRSSTRSTSSTSRGIGGFAFRGLYVRLILALPLRFMFCVDCQHLYPGSGFRCIHPLDH